MPKPTMDFETYSEAGFVWTGPSDKYPLGRWVPPAGAKEPGIFAVAAPAYSEHPTTEVLTLSYDLCDGRGMRRWRPGQPNPLDLFAHVQTGTIEAHNAMFERLIWENVCERLYGWPPCPPTAWRCSMATALVAQRPAALAPLADVLGLSDQKDKDGKRLIKLFSIPQQPIPGLIDKKTGIVKRPDQPARRVYPHDEPGEFEKFCVYCDQDVRTEQAASDAMPEMEPHEILAWQYTQDMNYRGFAIDREGLRACVDILGQVLERYGQECEQMTGLKATQLEKLKGWLAAYGVHTNSLDAENLAELLKREDLHPDARRVLELRDLTGSASVKKTLAIENRVSADNRLRDLVIHHGTRPGRPSGEGPQPLNLPKAGPKLSWCDCGRPSQHAPHCPWCGGLKSATARQSWQSTMVDHVLEVMSCGSLDMVEQYFGDAMLAIQGCVRGLFVADDGKQLVSTDYSSLQAVVAACLSGEQWRIDAFKRGDPIYLLGASKITGRTLEFYLDWFAEHGDHHPDRQYIGKVSELACFGPQTQVLTHLGYVDMEDIRTDHFLWDGVEWIRHDGLVPKGPRDAMRLDGVTITPDHQVNLNGSWKAARQLASHANTLSQALATGSENLPSWARKAAAKTAESSSNARAKRFRISSPCPIYAKARRHAATGAPKKRRGLRAAKTSGGSRISYRTSAIVAGCSIASRRASLVAAPAIRPKERKTTRLEASGYTLRGGRALKVGAPSSRTSSDCRAGIFLRLSSTASKPMGITNPATYGSSLGRKTRVTKGRSKTCKPFSTFTSPCFDIANAGSRNRFTIKTDSGHLLVHNCGFQGWINSYRAFGSDETDEVIRAQILAWRAASPAIVEMWGGQWRGPPWRRERQERFGLEGMFINAVENPGMAFDYRGVGFCMEEPDCLVIRLPLFNGVRRPLRYHAPRLTPSQRNPDELSISYETWNTNAQYGARGWTRMPTWGGRVFENVVMGVEVNIQRFGADLLAANGYPMVLGVYDEDVCEIPVGHPLTLGLRPVEGLDPHVQEIEHLLSILPPEIAGWPIRAAGGWRGRRYRKG